MLCERCKKNEATIHVSETQQGKTREQHLCSDCARELGIGQPFKSYLDDLFGQNFKGSTIFNMAGGIPAFDSTTKNGTTQSNTICSGCGQSYEDFRRSGLLGCSHCYDTFETRLDEVFRRVQGGTRHVGRKVNETADQQELQLMRHRLVELKTRLKQAVQEEAYEKAATLRDEAHVLEQQIHADKEVKT